MTQVVNGIQALKEIKKANSKTSIIMVTTDNVADTIKELEKLNVIVISIKPFKTEAIFETIKNINK